MNGDWLVVIINKMDGAIFNMRCNTQDAAIELGKWFAGVSGVAGESYGVFSRHDPKRSDPL